MNDDYPCVFGCVSITGPLPGSIHEKMQSGLNARLIFGEPGSGCMIFLSGDSPDIHYIRSSNDIHIVLGRTYAPVHLSQSADDLERLVPYLQEDKLAEIDGNFLYIHSVIGNNTSPRFRISTDKYGSKMVLYHELDGILYFSTHLDGLLALLGGNLPAISVQSLMHYYHFGQTANNATLYEGICKIPPASTLEPEASHIVIKKYFRLVDLYRPGDFSRATEEELCESINTLMRKSLINRLQGAKSVGITLSGGVDSGYIAKLVKELGIDFVGYNLAYKGKYDEYDRLDMLSRDLGLEVRKLELNPEEIIESYTVANRFGSEPLAFNDATLRLAFIEGHKDGIDTMLEGGGADHLFFGMYKSLLYYKTWKAYHRLRRVGLNRLVAWILGRSSGNEYRKLSVLFRNWQRGIPPYPKRRMGNVEAYDAENEFYVYSLGAKKYWDNFIDEFGTDDMRLYFTYQNIGMDPEEHFYSPSEMQLPMGMFPVSPYWQTDLVSLALSMPMDLKTKNGVTKYILRKAAAENQQDDYWMLAKIGLASSLDYLKQCEVGKEWIRQQQERIVESEEYGLIRENLSGDEVECGRLMPLEIWKQARSSSNGF